jgi:hypothetical protein
MPEDAGWCVFQQDCPTIVLDLLPLNASRHAQVQSPLQQ